MHLNTFIMWAAILLLNLSPVSAFWRLLCDGSVGLARIDPLMNYEGVSEHVHSIKGGSAFSPTSLSVDLAESNCTSCDVKEDNSAYWTPALYFWNSDNNTMEVVPEKPPHKTYYFLNSGSTSDGKEQKIEAFPHGFKMISGSNRNRNSSLPDPDSNPLGPWVHESQDLRAQRALGFNCLNYAKGTDEPSLFRHSMPEKSYLDQNCPDGVRLELMFPSCWNGQLDGGKDHKSHVAFPDGVMVGNCPAGFDRRLVSLFFETIVATDQFKGKNGKFVFSNGDPTGFGYHGDFIEAWESNVLQQAIDQCTNLSGNQEDCPVFTILDKAAECQLQSPLPAPLSTEEVQGPMKGLPNGIQVQSGPEQASKPGNSRPTGYTSLGQPKASPIAPTQATSVAKVPTVALSKTPNPKQPASTPGSEFFQLKNHVAQASSSIGVPLPLAHTYDAAPLPSSLSTSLVSSSSSLPPPATTVPPEEPSVSAQQQVITTRFYTSGRELHEVIVVLEEITVTATGPYAKGTPVPTSESDASIHHRRRIQHQHHAAHGIAGRRAQ